VKKEDVMHYIKLSKEALEELNQIDKLWEDPEYWDSLTERVIAASSGKDDGEPVGEEASVKESYEKELK